MRVPCIMRWPGTIPAGMVCPELITAMDFLPTFATLAGGDVPDDRTIDGRDIGPLMLGLPEAASPHEAFFYYREHALQAVRAGDWKLHLLSGELYNLRADIGETTDVSADHPRVVADLQVLAAACRQDLGDSATGAEGENRRPCGRVDDPRPLTTLDPDQPYMVAMYD